MNPGGVVADGVSGTGSVSGTAARRAADPFPEGYHDLEDYGVIGNNRTAALVSREGSVDFAGFPRFDSPPTFLSLLDREKGGRFLLGAAGSGITTRLSYEPGTNVLEHTFHAPDGSEAVLLDFCPEVGSGHILMSEIHRRLSVLRGTFSFRLSFQPRFGYAREVPQFEVNRYGVLARSPAGSASLSTYRPLRVEGNGVEGSFSLSAGQEEWFVFAHGSEVVTPLEAFQPAQRLESTLQYWRAWSGQATYHGRWRSAVERSSLLLKLLFYRPTGAMVAAPTTSMPEDPGGVRNWDYRFTWIRDTALAVRSLFRLGYEEEAVDFIYWLLTLLVRDRDQLRVLYDVEGRHPPPEIELTHLEGYRGSRPIRVGNAAHEQVQHDMFGNVLDVANLLEIHGGVVSVDLWRELRHLVNRVVGIWEQPDRGIWEVRGPPRHFVYSKAMCWVALDRAISLGSRLGMVADYETWERTREAIRQSVLTRGLTSDGKAFAWYYGAEGVDASLLRLPVIGFIPAQDPRMEETVRRAEADLVRGPLVYRYKLDDGLPGTEGTFLPCAFWLVEYYTLRGELERARRLLEELLSRSGPLGLLPEEMTEDGHFLGNFPQAFSHLAFLLAATRLNDALERRRSVSPVSLPPGEPPHRAASGAFTNG
jgi:GH15 family glucan-1,4-alpha-glucosidase